jgi:hypothetical protein
MQGKETNSTHLWERICKEKQNQQYSYMATDGREKRDNNIRLKGPTTHY